MRHSRRIKRMSRNRLKITKMNLTSLMDVFTILVFFLLVNSGSVEILEAPNLSALIDRGCLRLGAFERLLAERPSDVVVTSGKNDKKMASIHRLHAEGFYVLGDKPWLIGEDDVPMLAPTTSGAPHDSCSMRWTFAYIAASSCW